MEACRLCSPGQGKVFPFSRPTLWASPRLASRATAIYPDSVYAADLLISFSPAITAFSILYAPEEYACDSSATMRVTAYYNGGLARTATTNAVAGTWPSETLAFGSTQG